MHFNVITSILLLIVYKVQCQGSLSSPVVMTTHGLVRGRILDYKGERYDYFQGIPFAKPPVGNLRWRRPQEADRWDGVRDGTKPGSPCVQLLRNRNDSSEDCLYLNVYVPGGVNLTDVVPVMFYVHGGGYLFGNGDFYNSEILSLHANVVIVTTNYRLSTLGFMSSGDDASPGNFGLWDCRAALQWVKNNILSFRGDPNQVTAFGLSAGGGMVSHLLISSQTNHLFQRAIIMSGHASGFIGISNGPKASFKNLAEHFDCLEEDSEGKVDTNKTVHCLRQQDAYDLDLFGYTATILDQYVVPNWIPVVDGYFVPQHPRLSFAQGAAKNHDVIIGNTNHDAAGFVLLNIVGTRDNDTYGIGSDKNTLLAALTLIANGPHENPNTTITKLLTKYPDLDSSSALNRSKTATRMLTDWWFNSATYKESTWHDQTKVTNKTTYLYNFNYRQSFHHYPAWVRASHATDLYSVFGEVHNKEGRKEELGPFTSADKAISRRWMSYIANFANTGNTNNGPSRVSVPWPQYDATTKSRMNFGSEINMDRVTQQESNLYEYFYREIIYPRPMTSEKEDKENLRKLPKDFEWRKILPTY